MEQNQLASEAASGKVPRMLFLLSALAVILSGLLFVLVGFWLLDILLKPDSLKVGTGPDKLRLLAQSISIQQDQLI